MTVADADTAAIAMRTIPSEAIRLVKRSRNTAQAYNEPGALSGHPQRELPLCHQDWRLAECCGEDGLGRTAIVTFLAYSKPHPQSVFWAVDHDYGDFGVIIDCR